MLDIIPADPCQVINIYTLKTEIPGTLISRVLPLQVTESSMAQLVRTYSFMTALTPKCFLWKVTEARSPLWKAATENSEHSADVKIPCSVSGTWSSVSRNMRCAILRYYSGKRVSTVTALSCQGGST